ncbi:MAG: SDR family NAD(P)-dependent oxidoreductase [Actinobacteria bacterium ATB1]|nr:SDR family NAD(P)-dependent oxidoreductase [Actinobacteria bacterium ATB1]
MQDFRGRTAVVTGAASGIGLALARRLAAEGMNLVVCDIEDEPLAAAVEELGGRGVEVLSMHADVSDPAAVEGLAAAAETRFGPVAVVCNNAGVAVGGLSWEVAPEDWNWIIGVNLKGVVNGIRSFVSRMVAAGVEGHVVNTASIAGLTSSPLMGPYNVTKHGVVTLSEVLAGELAMVGANIGVSVLCPGWVATRIHESDRNRPHTAETTPEMDQMAEAVRSVIGGLIESGMSPDDVADEVLDAIRTGRFYIRPHAGMETYVEARCKAVLGGTTPAVIGPFEITAQ